MLFFTGLIFLLILLMQPLTILHFFDSIDVLFPAGWVARKERNLLLILQTIMLFVVIPVYILTFVFSWKYSAKNPKGKYDPDFVDNTYAECIWWGVPFVITLIICSLTWIKTIELDPYRPLISDKKPITIQVVALQWKWLFIYPEEKIATVNFFQIPENVPINFEITADAPMNSFWIPDLGGQIYAMPNMQTELYLMANKEGDFRGSSANLSGEGFSGMHFIARASSEEAFQKWVTEAQKSTKNFDATSYRQLAAPSSNFPIETYSLKEDGLFKQILHQHMHP